MITKYYFGYEFDGLVRNILGKYFFKERDLNTLSFKDDFICCKKEFDSNYFKSFKLLNDKNERYETYFKDRYGDINNIPKLIKTYPLINNLFQIKINLLEFEIPNDNQIFFVFETTCKEQEYIYSVSDLFSEEDYKDETSLLNFNLEKSKFEPNLSDEILRIEIFDSNHETFYKSIINELFNFKILIINKSKITKFIKDKDNLISKKTSLVTTYKIKKL